MPKANLSNPRVKITYRIPKDLLERLKENARLNKITDTKIVEDGIRLYLNQLEGEEK